MVKDKNIRVQARVTKEFKDELDDILKEINKNPNTKSFGVRDIVYQFVKQYKETQPYGLVLETQQLNDKLKKINTEIENLTKERDKLTAQIKVNEEIINNKKLDDYKDQYTLKLEEAKEDYNKRLSGFSDIINKDDLLLKVCKKYEIDNIDDLRKIL